MTEEIQHDPAHSIDSSLREKLLEHLFVGELLRCLWQQGVRDMEVLHAEIDRAGYDLVVECNGMLRHIQLKSSYKGAKTSRVNIHTSLADKPSGCVIWMQFDPETLALGPFLWLGGAPGKPLPPLGERIARHTKGDQTGYKAERPNLRVVNKGEFTVLDGIGEVTGELFG